MNNFKKFISEKLYRLSSSSTARKILRILHVDGLAKFFYFKLFQTKEGKCSYVLDGIEAKFYTRDKEETEYIMSGAGLEHRVLATLLQHIKPSDTVYDIGSAIGFHAVFFAKRASPSGRVIALEPDSARYEALCANVKLNHLTNVTPLQLALGDIKKKGILRHTDADLRVELISTTREAQDQIIDIMPGDSLIEDNNLPKPNVVKIDVEGYEYLAIEGLKKTLQQDFCKIVFCEIHPNQLPAETNPKMIFDKLKSFGFNRIDTYDRGNTFHILCYK